LRKLEHEHEQKLTEIADWLLVRGINLLLGEVDEKFGQARAIMEEGLNGLPVVCNVSHRKICNLLQSEIIQS
jgi:hypothetical protein